MPRGQYDRSKAGPRKTPRGPLTAEEKDQIEKLYRAGEHSMRDIAEEINSNPASVRRVLTEREVPLRPPGTSEISVRNAKRNAARRKAEAEVRMAQEIAESRRQQRIDRKADQLGHITAAAGAMLIEEARASVALDRDETHVVGEPFTEITEQAMSDDEPRHEIRWQPREGEHMSDAQDVAELVHQVDELLSRVGFVSAQLAHGHLVWQPTSDTGPSVSEWTPTSEQMEHVRQIAGERYGFTEEPTIDGLQAEYHAELERAHAWSQHQWGAGVRHGYEQATSGIVDLLKDCMRHVPAESNGHRALEDFLEMLEDGEHFYRQHKDKKPWLREENWR